MDYTKLFREAWEKHPYKEEWAPWQIEMAQRNPEYGLTTITNKEGWHNAGTPEERERYHQSQQYANKLYGNFTGGDDGSEFHTLGPLHSEADALGKHVTDYGAFSYSRTPEHQAALDRVLNYGAFSYDPETDPVYASYRKAYTREGRRSGEDTLGQYAAVTGGRPSTAAVTAAQQAENYYAAKLADKVPELYGNAYDRYLREYQRQLQGLEALEADRRFEYGAYGDEFDRLRSRYQTLRNQENAERERQDAAAEKQRQLAREKLLDEAALAQQDLENRRQAARDEEDRRQTELNNKLALAKLGISVGDYSWLKDLDINPDMDALLRGTLASMGRTVSVGGAGSGGSVKQSASSAADYSAADRKWAQSILTAAAQGKLDRGGYEYALAREILSGEPFLNREDRAPEADSEPVYQGKEYRGMTDVMEMMVEAGRTPKDRLNELDIELRVGTLTQEEYNALKSKYVDAFLALPAAFSSRREARDWLISAGVPQKYAGRVPDETEWAREREDPRTAAAAYGTYGEYLTAYAADLLKNYG